MQEQGRNITISGDPRIFTLMGPLIVDEDGNGIMNIFPPIDTARGNHGEEIDIHVNETIDRGVGAIVMGWTLIRGEVGIKEWLASAGHQPPPAEHAHYRCIWVDPSKAGYAALVACEECGDFPEFSTDIQRAFSILDKISPMGFSLYGPQGLENLNWRCVFRGGWADGTYVEAPSAAFAICVAAMKHMQVMAGKK